MSRKCKQEENYDNCGPNTKGDYCLFHKPNKTEEEAKKFYQALKKKEKIKIEKEKGEKSKLIFENSLDWKGYIFPKVPGEGDFSFNEAIFKREAFFSEARFEREVDFWSAEFKRGAFFHNTSFKNESNFTFVNFKGLADFSEAVFKEKAEFMLSTFEELAIFSETKIEREVGFDYATFKKESNFYNTEIEKEALFSNASFEEKAIFNNAIFSGLSDFSEVSFEDEVAYKNTIFRDEGNFEGAIFRDNLFFNNTKFEGEFSLKNAKLEKFGDFTESSFLGKSRFNYTKFGGNTEFDNSTFTNTVSFEHADFEEDVSFKNMNFSRTPNFIDAKFEGKVTFRHTTFDQGIELIENQDNSLEDKYTLPEAREEACRIQKISYEKEGRREDADSMLVSEMRARREQKNPIIAFFEFIIADMTCKYGTSWKRVLASSGSFILGFSLISWLFTKFSEIGRLMSSSGGEPVLDFWNHLYFSVINFTMIGNIQYSPEGILKLFTGLETLLGALFIALLIVVLARKWMR